MKSYSELDWSSRRRLIYIITITLIIIAYVIYKIYPALNPPANCNDNKQNGTELGIDCGGGCNLQCKNTYQPLEIVLQKAFVSGLTSDLLVLLENKNRYVAPYIIKFDLDVYDNSGNIRETLKINQIAGTQKYIPIVIEDYKSNEVAKIFAKNIEYDMYNSRGAIDIALSDYKMNDDNTKLKMKIRNIYKQDITESVRLYVLLRDENNNITAINYQDLTPLRFEEVRELNFLWGESVSGNVRNVDLVTVSKLYR